MTTPNIPIGEGVNYPEPDSRSPKIYRYTPMAQQVSVGHSGVVGLVITDKMGNPVDSNQIIATIIYGKKQTSIDTFNHGNTGEYSFILPQEVISVKQEVKVVWEYEVDDVDVVVEHKVIVRDPMPTYDSMSESERGMVEAVSMLFADMFDSAEGGAFLTEVFQSNFSLERIAQLSRFALNRINTAYMPMTNYFIGSTGVGSGRFPEKYMGVLQLATYLEVIRHLMRSYVEIPEFKNMETTYTDRRDYYGRWRQILKEEEDNLKSAIMFMKRDLMNLSCGSLIVSGGIFGSGSSMQYIPGMHTAMQRSMRFYPAFPSVSSTYYRGV